MLANPSTLRVVIRIRLQVFQVRSLSFRCGLMRKLAVLFGGTLTEIQNEQGGSRTPNED